MKIIFEIIIEITNGKNVILQAMAKAQNKLL